MSNRAFRSAISAPSFWRRLEAEGGGGGGDWSNEPSGWTRIIDKQCGNTNMGVDDILNEVNWFHSDGTPTVVTDETGEPESPNTAYEAEFPNGSSNGARWQQVALYDVGRDWYFGITFKLASNWDNSLAILKILWFTLGGGKYTILKCDGTGPTPTIQYTGEHGGGVGTFNTGGEDIVRNQWYRIEGRVTHPVSEGGSGTFKLWIDGVSVLNTTHAATSDTPTEIDLQPYSGGVGTWDNPTSQCYIGHVIVSVP